tara:strand:+ start:65 stop:934 length:870 start_codon:yes stop_codon:yes gene_type:complete
MANTQDRYVRVKSKSKSGYNITKWKDTKTGKLLDSIPVGANVKQTGGELGVGTLSEQVRENTAKRQKEFITSNRDRSSGIIGGVTPDKSVISQAVEREKEFKRSQELYPDDISNIYSQGSSFDLESFEKNYYDEASVFSLQQINSGIQWFKQANNSPEGQAEVKSYANQLLNKASQPDTGAAQTPSETVNPKEPDPTTTNDNDDVDLSKEIEHPLSDPDYNRESTLANQQKKWSGEEGSRKLDKPTPIQKKLQAAGFEDEQLIGLMEKNAEFQADRPKISDILKIFRKG